MPAAHPIYTTDPSSLDATLTPNYCSPCPHHPPPMGVSLSKGTSPSTTSQTHQCPTPLLRSLLTLTTPSTCRPIPSALQYGHFTSAGGSTSPVIVVNYPITHPTTTSPSIHGKIQPNICSPPHIWPIYCFCTLSKVMRTLQSPPLTIFSVPDTLCLQFN